MLSAVMTAVGETLSLSQLGPVRNLGELLAQQVKYVPAKHQVEASIPPGLEPVNGPQQHPSHAPASLTVEREPIASTSKAHLAQAQADSSSSLQKQQQLRVNGSPTKTKSSSEFSSHWPSGIRRAAHGLHNRGNTCYLNATLQAILHSPALVSALMTSKAHTKARCAKQHDCTLCTMSRMMQEAYSGNSHAVVPQGILGRLRKIAPHFRMGRQEDSHEFLRFLMDSFQAACLAEWSPNQLKANPKLKETTLIHRLFGGRFCSRVHCTRCGHNSDTFDSFLDLSLQLTHNTPNLKSMLNLFTKPDHLRGSNRYKCEKCKTLVDATKSLSIDKAPHVLTVHFKRFSPLRTKINAHVTYPEEFDLSPWMISTDSNVTYRLDSIISHSGSSPHSGHYYAHVRSGSGKWFRQDDSSSSPVAQDMSSLLSMRSAYVLMYTRIDSAADSRSSSEEAAAAAGAPAKADGTPKPSPQLPRVQGMKRKQPEESEPDERPFNRPRVQSMSSAGPTANGNPFSMPSPSSTSGLSSAKSADDVGQQMQRPRSNSMPSNSRPAASKSTAPGSFYGGAARHNFPAMIGKAFSKHGRGKGKMRR